MAISKEIKELSKLSKEDWKEYTKTVWQIANTSHGVHPAVFPEEIPHRLIKLFSFHGETVLDPFGGVGTTAKAAIPLNRKTILMDQNKDYLKIAANECAPLLNEANNPELLTTIYGDSAKMKKIADESVDLIITSPPYWDKVDYGPRKCNIGSKALYQTFLDRMKPVYEECYRALQPGRKMCIVTANVNQHTDHGLLTFPLAADFGLIMRKIGFVMINEIIWSKDKTGGRWGSSGSQRPIFGSYPYPPNFLFKNVHEYVLIFAKPGIERKGKTVRKYDELVGDLFK